MKTLTALLFGLLAVTPAYAQGGFQIDPGLSEIMTSPMYQNAISNARTQLPAGDKLLILSGQTVVAPDHSQKVTLTVQGFNPNKNCGPVLIGTVEGDLDTTATLITVEFIPAVVLENTSCL